MKVRDEKFKKKAAIVLRGSAKLFQTGRFQRIQIIKSKALKIPTLFNVPSSKSRTLVTS